MRTASIGILLALVASAPAGESPPASVASVTCIEQLLKLNKCQLLDLYQSAKAGSLPAGYTPGRVLPNPGKRNNDSVSRLIQATIWQGKFFDPDGMMTNKQFGVRTNRGYVFTAPSILDDKPAHFIDYSDSWRVWQPYVDELREVAPGIYLGITWRNERGCLKFLTYFALDARKDCCQRLEAK